MDQEFKTKWEEFLASSTYEVTRLDKELAHKFFILGRDGRFPDQKPLVPATAESSR